MEVNDVISTISSNTDDLASTVVRAGGLGVAVAASLLALSRGWAFFKRMIS